MFGRGWIRSGCVNVVVTHVSPFLRCSPRGHFCYPIPLLPSPHCHGRYCPADGGGRMASAERAGRRSACAAWNPTAHTIDGLKTVGPLFRDGLTNDHGCGSVRAARLPSSRPAAASTETGTSAPISQRVVAFHSARSASAATPIQSTTTVPRIGTLQTTPARTRCCMRNRGMGSRRRPRLAQQAVGPAGTSHDSRAAESRRGVPPSSDGSVPPLPDQPNADREAQIRPGTIGGEHLCGVAPHSECEAAAVA
jgi:hypothetical protein